MPRNFINWSCKLTLCQRERDGGGGQPPVKSEVRAQSSKVGRLWFLGVDAQEYPGVFTAGMAVPMRTVHNIIMYTTEETTRK